MSTTESRNNTLPLDPLEAGLLGYGVVVPTDGGGIVGGGGGGGGRGGGWNSASTVEGMRPPRFRTFTLTCARTAVTEKGARAAESMSPGLMVVREDQPPPAAGRAVVGLASSILLRC